MDTAIALSLARAGILVFLQEPAQHPAPPACRSPASVLLRLPRRSRSACRSGQEQNGVLGCFQASGVRNTHRARDPCEVDLREDRFISGVCIFCCTVTVPARHQLLLYNVADSCVESLTGLPSADRRSRNCAQTFPSLESRLRSVPGRMRRRDTGGSQRITRLVRVPRFQFR